jgi:hypothetical protein
MTTQTSRQVPMWGTKTKALIAGLLLVATMVLTSMIAAASPARASTTFVVNGTGDAPDASTTASACDTDTSTTGKQCTLRAAIEQANATAGADAINFDIPGTGVKTISPASDLPNITDQVSIDGYTQTGATPNTRAVGNDAALKVQLNGTNADAVGIEIDGNGASNSLIRGLVINRFGSSSIDVFSSSIAPSSPSTGVRIQGNFLGTDPTGTLDRGNGGAGVSVFSNDISGTVIGGTTPADRNLVSGNHTGVDMGDQSADLVLSQSIRVQGNYLGTDRNGTKDLGNDLDGIFLEGASGATIGGKTAASRNVVSGNGAEGVELFHVSGTKVLGNRIGTSASGTGALGNDLGGVFVGGGDRSSSNEIGDGTAAGSNTIAFNDRDGAEIASGTGNKICHNSVFSNAGLGIDLRGPGEDFSTSVPTKNDAGDTDDGPNNLQNKTVLTSAKTVSGKTTIAGKLESTAGQTFTVEFYANPDDTNEGKTFLGEKTITTTVDGIRSFTFSPATAVKAGQAITATATNDSTHDTSEFSAPRTVASS